MPVYIDDLTNNGWIFRGKPIKSCHLIADTVDELLAFGKRIGLKCSWLQGLDRTHIPHFDLVPSKRKKAVVSGAKPLGRDEFVGVLQKIREKVLSTPV